MPELLAGIPTQTGTICINRTIHIQIEMSRCRDVHGRFKHVTDIVAYCEEFALKKWKFCAFFLGFFREFGGTFCYIRGTYWYQICI